MCSEQKIVEMYQ